MLKECGATGAHAHCRWGWTSYWLWKWLGLPGNDQCVWVRVEEHHERLQVSSQCVSITWGIHATWSFSEPASGHSKDTCFLGCSQAWAPLWKHFPVIWHVSGYWPDEEAEMQKRAELRGSENQGLRPAAGLSPPDARPPPKSRETLRGTCLEWSPHSSNTGLCPQGARAWVADVMVSVRVTAGGPSPLTLS